MKTERYIWHPATLFFLLTCVVVFLSWILEVYGVQASGAEEGEVYRIRSLLSPEGIRWMLRHVVSNFMDYPSLGSFVLVVSGIGVSFHSGLVGACARRWKWLGRIMRSRLADFTPRPLSRKERRALQSALVSGGIYAGVILFATFSPWGILRGVNGGVFPSPLTDGFPFLFAAGVLVMSTFYGCIAGRYRTDADVAEGLLHFGRFVLLYLLVVFFASQMFACMDYSRLHACIGMWTSAWAPFVRQSASFLFHFSPFLLTLWYSWSRLGI